MYNGEQKERFLQSLQLTNVSGWMSFFNKATHYETELGKDICEMSTDELNELIMNNYSASPVWVKDMSSMILQYKKWCVSQSICVQYPDETATLTTTNKIKNGFVFSPEHLQSVLDEILDDEKIESTDILIRVACWLVYMGVQAKHFMHIKPSDFYFDTLILKIFDCEFPLYRESVHAFKVACFATEFTYKHVNYNHDIKRPRIINGSIFDSVRTMKDLSPERRIENIRNTVAKASKNTTYRDMLLFKNLRSSGMFYRQYNQEIMTGVVDFKPWIKSEILLESMFGEQRYSGDAEHLSKMIINLNISYKKSYKVWKTALQNRVS